jgi:hypothetical protein
MEPLSLLALIRDILERAPGPNCTLIMNAFIGY